MPPTSKIGTFVAAVKSGETETTKAAERALSSGRRSLALRAAVRKKNAFKKPLQTDLRDALRAEHLDNATITKCIDSWPNSQKEKARSAVAGALRSGKRIRIRWGLASGSSYETKIKKTATSVTIIARSPRTKLRTSHGEIHVH